MNYFQKKEINNNEFDEEEFFKESEKDQNRSNTKINKEIFILKIKQFLLKLNHFPALVKKFIIKTLFGLLRLWGIILVILIFLFLYFTDSYTTIYYKVKINFEKSNIEHLEKVISNKKLELIESEKDMNCYKNQFKRIANSQFVDINYCKTK